MTVPACSGFPGDGCPGSYRPGTDAKLQAAGLVCQGRSGGSGAAYTMLFLPAKSQSVRRDRSSTVVPIHSGAA